MIFSLMSKSVILYWLVFFLNCMCNLKSVRSKEPVHSSYKGKYTANIKNYEIVVPQRVNKDGNFISHLVSHHHSKRSTKELEFIFYKIPIEGKDYLIELTPNLNLISPGAVVEIHRDDVEFSEQTSFNESSSNEKIGKLFRNLDIRKLENTECHFLGHVKGENVSKAALSTCYGLAGFIQIMKGFYTIEPVAEHDPFVEDAYPHMLYKSDGVENSSICHTIGELKASLVDQVIRKRRESNLGLSLPLYIETLIVMDKALINHYRDSDCENYVLTVFNMAFNLFHDASAGLMMTLTIVKIIRLEVENDEMNLRVNADAEKTLRYFQTWQYEMNPGDDSHPNHHDVAVLITRVNICYSPSTCGLLGLTTIGKACDPKLSAALCEDDGLRLGYIIAHEIGHLLGADHDADNSTCNGTDADGLKTIMHPSISLTAQTWSACSQAYFKAFFGSGMGSCLLDEPEEHHFKVQELLPGVMYGADFQCKHLISMKARECDMGSTCDSLNCYVPGYACVITHTPPADGTRCGENMWCHDAKCLVVGERPGAVDGNWGEWSAWGDCSRTCGSGVASSVRNCDKPQPSHGGKNCVGERKRYKICAATPCETGRPSFRDIQCGEFDDWIYPEDGKIHTWKAYFFHDDNPCVLFCINENKEVAALRPRVVDGTMCYRGIRDICVAGTCKSLPCDLHFESNAVEDACGVCHGDGTGCEFSEGVETLSKLAKGFTKLVHVPAGSRNIKVEEMSPTLANIIVRDADSKETYVRGISVGMFNVPGSSAWLGMIKKNQEALNIPGPVTKPLSIWIQRLDNVTVKWSMALPAEQQRKGEFAWDFLKWGPCSAFCGPGTQVSEPSCMEGKSGLVEDSFCADLEMPPAKVRQCEIAKCEPRWMVGDWKGCEPPSQKKERKRVVYCIKQTGEGEGESQIVSDSECPEPKPHGKELCENRQKREDADYTIDRGFLEPESTFKSDTSEFGFHKKYEDYLKHFAALPVPQRNCETIPLYLVSSPHFKHYFHVLETPEDFDANSGSGSGSGSGGDKSFPGGTSHDPQGHNEVSPEFYKETFSGQQIGVSHIQSMSRETLSLLEDRSKKSVSQAPRQRQGTAEMHSRFKNICQRSKRKGRKMWVQAHKPRIRRKQTRDPSIKRSRHFNFWRRKQHVKSFEVSPSTRSNIVQNVDEKDESDDVKANRWGGLWKVFSSQFPIRRRAFEVSDDIGDTCFRLDQDRHGPSPLTSGNIRQKSKNNHPKYETSIAWKFLPNSGRNFMERHSIFKEFFSRGIGKSHQRGEKVFKQKRMAKSPCAAVRKRKRSSRKWKKPKSKDANVKQGKEQGGNTCGTETKNYLNNLFRDTHPSSSNKPPEVKSKCEKLVIKEGLVVIDKDLAENQEVDVLFDCDESNEKRKKYNNLPRPSQNERKLTIKGQDVFKLFQELQQPSQREYSPKGKSPGSLEINEENNSGGQTTKPRGGSAGKDAVKPLQAKEIKKLGGSAEKTSQGTAMTYLKRNHNSSENQHKEKALENDTRGAETQDHDRREWKEINPGRSENSFP